MTMCGVILTTSRAKRASNRKEKKPTRGWIHPHFPARGQRAQIFFFFFSLVLLLLPSTRALSTVSLPLKGLLEELVLIFVHEIRLVLVQLLHQVSPNLQLAQRLLFMEGGRREGNS